jgi:hypothetical protein
MLLELIGQCDDKRLARSLGRDVDERPAGFAADSDRDRA